MTVPRPIRFLYTQVVSLTQALWVAPLNPGSTDFLKKKKSAMHLAAQHLSHLFITETSHHERQTETVPTP